MTTELPKTLAFAIPLLFSIHGESAGNPSINASAEELDRQRLAYAARPDAYQETYRPRFHFSGLTGWLNDPNGLVYHDGEYHLYFQAWPQNVKAAGKIWSHAVSSDLVHWEQIEHAILNEGQRMIWSGSAVVDHHNSAGFNQGENKALIAFYTLTGPFVQCLAYSHDRGRSFTKIEEPIIGEINRGTRDPKVFWSDEFEKWIMILHGAPFMLFESNDLKKWIPLGELPLKGLSECPELFELPVDNNPNNTRWVVWGGRGAYYLGDFDGKRFSADFDNPLESEHASRGIGSYAGQTFNDTPDGRRIMISWLKWKPNKNLPDAPADVYPGMPFAQQMAVPREVSLKETDEGIRLFLNPVEELKTLRGKAASWKKLSLNPGNNPLSELSGETFDIELELNPGNAKAIVLDVRGLPLTIDPTTWTLDFQGNTMDMSGAGDTLSLRMLIDVNSIEIYAEDGRYVLSTSFLANPTNQSLSLTANGGTTTAKSLKIWPMQSIWKSR